MADDGNLSNVLRALERVKREIIEDTSKALDKSAAEVVSTMKAVAPVADVDGGELRDSIRVEKSDELSRTIIAGDAKADYARFVEFGNVNQPPANFFWGTWRLLRRRVQGRVNRAPGAPIRRFNRG